MGAPHHLECPRSAPTDAGDSPTIPASPCRSARPPRPPDLWPLWDAIRCPTLVLRGARNPTFSPPPPPRRWPCAGPSRGHRIRRRGSRADAPQRRPDRSGRPLPAGLEGAAAPAGRPVGWDFAYLQPGPRAQSGTIPYNRRRPSPLDRHAPHRSACPPSIRGRPIPPEIRPAKVFPWLDELLKRDPVEAARVIGDSLAAINRVDDERLEAPRARRALLEQRRHAWPLLEKQFSRASHPLSGEALEAAKAALGLAHELSVAYKHLLRARVGQADPADGQPSPGRARLHRCLQCTRGC